MRILVVEDESSILQTIEIKLKREGYEVTSCTNGLDALAQLKTFTPDIIITDILMPYISGLELISTIKLQQGLQHIPIIVLSTLQNEDSVQQAFDLGADDYLKKPFSLMELVTRVKIASRNINQG